MIAHMVYTAPTAAEAKALAVGLRHLFGRDGWVVTVTAPLFKGDLWYVVLA